MSRTRATTGARRWDWWNSAKQYIPETVWNDTTHCKRTLAASSGGVSQYYAQPSWQPTPEQLQPGRAGRLVPDVAFAASPNHDGYMTCSTGNDSTKTETTAPDGFLSSKELIWDVIGGTSAATPSFAGMLTLLVQKYGAQGETSIRRFTVWRRIPRATRRSSTTSPAGTTNNLLARAR